MVCLVCCFKFYWLFLCGYMSVINRVNGFAAGGKEEEPLIKNRTGRENSGLFEIARCFVVSSRLLLIDNR